MQLRFLDKIGDEKVRIDRINYATKPYIIEKKLLQNKANRYYFHDIFKLKDGEFWISNLDLNIEHKVLEIPHKPVLRVGTPLFYKGEKKGILIINIFMKNVLEKFLESIESDVFLLDKSGFVMYHKNDEYKWGRILEHGTSLETFFPGEMTKMLKESKYIDDRIIIKNLSLDNDDGIKMAIIPKQHYLSKQIGKESILIVIVLSGVFILSLPLTYFLSIYPSRLKKEVDYLNKNLEGLVSKKTVELTKANKKLKEKIKLSQTDGLTKIHNRFYLDIALKNQIYRFKRSKEACSMIYYDIDFFKSINDTYGHIVGDEVLVKMSNLVKSCLRESDVLGRWGGEEFMIILPHTDCEQALKIAEKLRKTIEIYDFGKVGKVTVSFGVTTFNDDSTMDTVFSQGDIALYKAKENGRNCVFSSC